MSRRQRRDTRPVMQRIARKFFLLRTKSSPPLNLHIYIFLSLFSPIVALVLQMSSVVTLSRPPSSSFLKVNNRSFHHTSPCLWNQLPKELRLPADHEDLSLLSDLTHVSSSFPSSPPSPSITPSLFHSRLKTHLFHKSFSL